MSILSKAMARRNAYFVLFGALIVVMSWNQLRTLLSFWLQDIYFSHIPLIPVIAAYFLWFERKKIFLHVHYSIGPGMILLTIGVTLYWIGQEYSSFMSRNDYLSLAILSIVLTSIAGFVLCYGTKALRAGAFPLGLLFLMVPFPDFLLERIIFFLQKGSADVSYVLFQLSGIPVFREGFLFFLPGLSIEVAKQCSGFRSSLALFIISLIVGHLFLQSGWRKVFLLSSILPILIAKNALRIVTLSLLALYVDESFVTGDHRYWGIPFFLLGLAMFVPIVRFLQRSESKTPEPERG